MKPEDSATRFEIVPFFHGRILDLSEGRVKTFPHFIWYQDARVMEPNRLEIFAGNSLDGVVSSFMLHLMPESDCVAALGEWCRVVKQGGHIVIHVPMGEHKWSVSRETVTALMDRTGRGFDLVCCKALDTGLLMAFKLIQGRGRAFSCDAPKPAKTCAVVRYGAFGDCIQASSILPWLKAQGYHITFYCSDHGKPVIEHDPHIDRFIIQGRDEVPPNVLGAFWEHERKKYDKWVNLSESVEATLLATKDRSNFDWPKAVKDRLMDVNYLEFTHMLAEVPPPYQPRFYATPDEKAWARKQARQFGQRNILWSLSGSSVHKTWPWLDAIVARFMTDLPDTHVVLVGDELSQILEAGWGKEKRVHCRSGKWSIRESMAFAEVADLIVGTETGLLNAAGSMDTPKIVTLSHSSAEMLTKHWKNTIALRQPAGSGCPRQPCRQLHQDFSTCMEHAETGTAMCQAAIGIEQMWDAVLSVMGDAERKVA